MARKRNKRRKRLKRKDGKKIALRKRIRKIEEREKFGMNAAAVHNAQFFRG
jgi:hypothetical protein